MDYCEDPARSCEHLNFPAHLSEMTCCWDKSSNFSKNFRLTTLVSESVEWLSNLQNINPDELLKQRRLYSYREYIYLFFLPLKNQYKYVFMVGQTDLNAKDWIPCLSVFSYHARMGPWHCKHLCENTRSTKGGYKTDKKYLA